MILKNQTEKNSYYPQRSACGYQCQSLRHILTCTRSRLPLSNIHRTSRGRANHTDPGTEQLLVACDSELLHLKVVPSETQGISQKDSTGLSCSVLSSLGNAPHGECIIGGQRCGAWGEQMVLCRQQGHRDPSHSPGALGHTRPPRLQPQLCQAVLPQLGWAGQQLCVPRAREVPSWGTAQLAAWPPLPHTLPPLSLLSELHRANPARPAHHPSLTCTRTTFGAL